MESFQLFYLILIKIYLFYQQMYSQLNHFGITLQINIWVFHLINLVYCILGAIRPHN